jgi:flotillin
MVLGLTAGIIFFILALIVFFLATYKVVDPNEAHVIVFMGRGRKVYAPKLSGDSKAKTAYFYIPFLMKRFVLPLTNVKIDINDIHLNDIEVAPFIADVITWIHIEDPIKAAERLDLTQGDVFYSLRQDLVNIVQAVARAVAMKQEVLDIMRDRKTFSESVSTEVDGVLKSWGVDLINLEVNDIRDDNAKESQVISDYESIRKVKVNSLARIQVAERDREAVEAEQSNRRKAEIATAEAEEALRKRQIQKDEAVGIAEQKQLKNIAEAKELANMQEVSAIRKLEVGKASVKKEATIEQATGEAEAVRVKGEKEAEVIKLKGEADGKAIEAKGTAEATAKDKMAEAMKKFNDSALNVEKIRAWIEVQKAQYEAYGKVAQNAEIKVVNSGKGSNILGLPLNAESGADLGQFLESMGGIDAVKDIIGKVKDTVAPKKKNWKDNVAQK